MQKTSSIILAAAAVIAFSSVQASENEERSKRAAESCPDTSFKADKQGNLIETAFDVEFGAGAKDMTRCLENREKVKVVMQVNTECGKKDASGTCVAPYGFRNVPSMMRDYLNTHGIEADDIDFRIVVHGSGGKLLLKGHKFNGAVQKAMNLGAKVYFCQNTIRSFYGTVKPDGDTVMHYGQATSEVMPGVQFVTGGLTALVDLQREGFRYIQP